MTRDKALQIAKVTKHQYYYQKTGRKSGLSNSTHTLKVDGTIVENTEVLANIEKTMKHPDTQYGYIKMWFALKTQGFLINKKKVYRLMKSAQILHPFGRQNTKTYAKYRKVLPEKPLHVLEMDIKFVWVEQAKKHAYILTVIDTFTRVTLYHTVMFSITKKEVKQAWEHIIIHHLQPNDCLNSPINIEVRNDNDKRFSAQLVQDFFKQNYLNQVFTHPYTPQENGHIESFHSILSLHLKPYTFWSLDELDQNLTLFYEHYNNVRIHGSIAYTSPQDFWTLWNLNLIDKKTDEKNRKTTFKLKIPYHQIKQHTGNNEPEGSSLHDFLKGSIPFKNQNKEMSGANISNNLRSKKSPSVVPCHANL